MLCGFVEGEPGVHGWFPDDHVAFIDDPLKETDEVPDLDPPKMPDIPYDWALHLLGKLSL